MKMCQNTDTNNLHSTCHSERSEESHNQYLSEILHCARDDNTEFATITPYRKALAKEWIQESYQDLFP